MDKAELRSLLIKHEGLSLVPYRCPAGRLTIGVGHNIEAHPLSEIMRVALECDGHISEEMAFELLDQDIDRVKSEASHFKFYSLLSESQKVAILDMLFNLGLPKFTKFKRTIALLEQENYLAASVEMIDSLWAKQVGDRAKELAKMIREG